MYFSTASGFYAVSNGRNVLGVTCFGLHTAVMQLRVSVMPSFNNVLDAVWCGTVVINQMP